MEQDRETEMRDTKRSSLWSLPLFELFKLTLILALSLCITLVFVMMRSTEIKISRLVPPSHADSLHDTLSRSSLERGLKVGAV